MRGPQGQVWVTRGSLGDKVLCSLRLGPTCSALGWGQPGTATREQREWGCPTLGDKTGHPSACSPPKPQAVGGSRPKPSRICPASAEPSQHPHLAGDTCITLCDPHPPPLDLGARVQPCLV